MLLSTLAALVPFARSRRATARPLLLVEEGSHECYALLNAEIPASVVATRDAVHNLYHFPHNAASLLYAVITPTEMDGNACPTLNFSGILVDNNRPAHQQRVRCGVTDVSWAAMVGGGRSAEIMPSVVGEPCGGMHFAWHTVVPAATAVAGTVRVYLRWLAA